MRGPLSKRPKFEESEDCPSVDFEKEVVNSGQCAEAIGEVGNHEDSGHFTSKNIKVTVTTKDQIHAQPPASDAPLPNPNG